MLFVLCICTLASQQGKMKHGAFLMYLVHDVHLIFREELWQELTYNVDRPVKFLHVEHEEGSCAVEEFE